MLFHRSDRHKFDVAFVTLSFTGKRVWVEHFIWCLVDINQTNESRQCLDLFWFLFSKYLRLLFVRRLFVEPLAVLDFLGFHYINWAKQNPSIAYKVLSDCPQDPWMALIWDRTNYAYILWMITIDEIWIEGRRNERNGREKRRGRLLLTDGRAWWLILFFFAVSSDNIIQNP